ncbi:hypothetical protein VP01_1375g2 [Puccinia sorghi]|uniref:Uncharacterized protein n=1 Tax=Puccinia sorghi TaxID=27349 RepID=A0A0L6VLJ1_9BASI|nr:hypothetical protein VP01_1375g2 [Puccinia sorghi]
MVVAFTPSTYYTTQFSVVLKEATLVTAAVMLNSETQIFFSGHLALSPPHHSPRIEVPSGDWILHNGGLDEDVAAEFTRARVYGTVYVTGICWNHENRWDSYVNVVDCSVGRMVKIKLYTMHHSPLKQLGMLQRGDRIHLQGWIPTGVRQEEGIIVIQVEVATILMREASTRGNLKPEEKEEGE